jgi:hypothetical protein
MMLKKMPPRASTPRVSLIEIKGAEELGRVEIVPMTSAHAKWWQTTVQPIIENNYRDLDDKSVNNATKKIRADRGWKWTNIRRLLYVHNVGHVGTWIGAHAIGLTMEAINKRGQRVPVGMLTFVPSYLCSSDKIANKTYMWFVSSAPTEIYNQFLDGDILEGVAKALFDASIIESYKCGLNGSLLLHASPDGGPKLVKIYQDMGFTPLPRAARPITLYRWRDRTQYMLLNADAALALSKDNDEYRECGRL